MHLHAARAETGERRQGQGKRRVHCPPAGHRHQALGPRHALREGVAGGQGQRRPVCRLHEEPRDVRHVARLLTSIAPTSSARWATRTWPCKFSATSPSWSWKTPRLLRVLGHRLVQIGQLDLAVLTFEQVLKLRPEEPQSYRDLALMFARRAVPPPARRSCL